jgi:hypothetical protein
MDINMKYQQLQQNLESASDLTEGQIARIAQGITNSNLDNESKVHILDSILSVYKKRKNTYRFILTISNSTVIEVQADNYDDAMLIAHKEAFETDAVKNLCNPSDIEAELDWDGEE